MCLEGALHRQSSTPCTAMHGGTRDAATGGRRFRSGEGQRWRVTIVALLGFGSSAAPHC